MSCETLKSALTRTHKPPFQITICQGTVFPPNLSSLKSTQQKALGACVNCLQQVVVKLVLQFSVVILPFCLCLYCLGQQIYVIWLVSSKQMVYHLCISDYPVPSQLSRGKTPLCVCFCVCLHVCIMADGDVSMSYHTDKM